MKKWVGRLNKTKSYRTEVLLEPKKNALKPEKPKSVPREHVTPIKPTRPTAIGLQSNCATNPNTWILTAHERIRQSCQPNPKAARIVCNSHSHNRLSSVGRSSHVSNQLGARSLGRNSNALKSANSPLQKILNRPFHIDRDLPKYSQNLNYKQSERRLQRFEATAAGRRMLDLDVQGNAIKFSIQWEFEKK